MQAFVIITERPLDLSAVASRYASLGKVPRVTGDSLFVDGFETGGRRSYLEIRPNDPPLGEFDEEELAPVRSVMTSLSFALLIHHGEKEAEFGILGFPVDGPTWIDNDHGLIIPIEEVRRRIAQGIPWLRASE